MLAKKMSAQKMLAKKMSAQKVPAQKMLAKKMSAQKMPAKSMPAYKLQHRQEYRIWYESCLSGTIILLKTFSLKRGKTP